MDDQDYKEALLLSLREEFRNYRAYNGQSFEGITSMFKELSGRLENKQLWIVDEVEKMTRTLGRGAIVDALRALDSIRVGNFIVGRRGQPSRFEWEASPAVVEKALEELEAPQDATSRLDESPSAAQAAEQKLLSHQFRLRPNLTVELRLPMDLTSTEAARLADFIKTLPFTP